ncbi:hypothetical protein DCAR_0207008 [Daucus carota subsp. sativus]|uniref:PX domain-containing protein n=2 Tax=Daucus carota subsp. sativus TaxID=79200 RepID=A0AAF0WDY8_DAUCS|nr:PREDICTED: uncharacterized protein LOC108210069 isoform X1 [Daucus carota subsp. sativus]WOG87777.1 hypothetical protein DCAR_0207008 [Daucus carota subsp. sativus]
MQRRSPPKHRHDGTSPLPMGMDWSPPPRKWSGRDTVWPHDPRSGWSFCVTIPSWAVLPKSRDSDPIVFYRVQVGIQSPQGITTMRGVLRRFNDFMKLLAALKKAFPRKNLPPAPPKGLLRIRSKALLEERRSSLEVWMEKLLSDIDISRSVVVASFLELEAAARSSFQDEKQNGGNSDSSVNNQTLSLKPESSSIQSVASASFTSDYGSDTAYEASEIGASSLGKDYSSEVGIEELSFDEDLTDPIERLMKYGMSNIDDGLFMGQAILDQLESFPRNKGNAVKVTVANTNVSNGNTSGSAYTGADTMEHMAHPDHSKAIHHARNFSSGSIGSDVSSLKGSISSNSGPNTLEDGSLDLLRGSGVSNNMGTDSELQFPSDIKLMLPLDHRQIMNRALITMQRRLVTAKTDFEDLISRLNQEVAVKDYLTRKVKDLEAELETTKQKSKENLQQAIIVEKERLTQMQWDMEELRQKSFEMELKLNSQQAEQAVSESEKYHTEGKDMMQELDATKQQLVELQKQHRELEVKSKADIKVLVKEIKSLRSSQAEYKQQLSESIKEKSETEKLLEQEKQNNEYSNTALRNLLHQCEFLHNRLQECNINLLDDDKLVIDPSSQTAASDLQKSDSSISLLLSKVQLLAKDDDAVSTTDNNSSDDATKAINQELRELLTNIFLDNTNLRKQVNSVLRYALKINTSSDTNDDEQPSEHTVQ